MDTAQIRSGDRLLLAVMHDTGSCSDLVLSQTQELGGIVERTGIEPEALPADRQATCFSSADIPLAHLSIGIRQRLHGLRELALGHRSRLTSEY